MLSVVPVRDKLLIDISLDVKVRPHPRPRFSKSGIAYTPKRNEELRLALGRPPFCINEACIVDSIVSISRSKRSKTNFPISRYYGDEDNLRKAICDLLVDVGYLFDDSLVLGGSNYKTFASSDTLTLKIWSVHGAS